jgi:hypothetical protein
LADQKTLKAKIAEIAKELKVSGKQKLNTADPDSFMSKSDRGAKMYHNAQVTVDEKYGLIVAADVVNQSVDANQLSIQAQQAQDTLGKKPETICADNGYYSVDDIEKMDTDINVIVPSQGQLIKERRPDTIKPFPKDAFAYDDTRDCYICPENKKLRRTNLTIPDRPNAIIYQAKGRDCKRCTHFGACTPSVNGRKIIRQKNEALMQRLAKLYDSDIGQQIYKLRKQKVELPFAHCKHNMNIRQLLLRGIAKAGIELNLCAIGYNLTRMIGLLSVIGLQEAMITI